MPIYTDKITKRLYIQFDFLGKTQKKRLSKKPTKSKAAKLETKLKNKLLFEANGTEAKRQIKFEDFLVEFNLTLRRSKPLESIIRPRGYNL